MPEVYIVDAIRTPMGRNKGSLSEINPVDLGATVLKELVSRNEIEPATIDDVIFGCINQIGAQSANLARNAVLAAGFPDTVPGVTIDRQCGSSQQALHFAAQGILAGSYDLAIAGGVEVMSLVPLNSGFEIGPSLGMGHPFQSKGWIERFGPERVHQFASGERIAAKWGITRDDMEEFALNSNRRADRAWTEGHFDREVLSIDGFDHDETIRTTTSREKMAGLDPISEGGLITAATASQLADAATGVLLASEKAVREYGLVPRARIHAMTVVGSDPWLMLTGPIPATAKVLERGGLGLDDIDLFEVNEAFASVVLAWAKETGADLARTNVNGGAIALGHALGATGTRLITTLLHELEWRQERFGLVTICEGGGLANATILERLRPPDHRPKPTNRRLSLHEGAHVSDAIGNRTLLDLLEERAALDPTWPWLIFEDRTGAVSEYSYGEFLESAKRVGAGFRQLGVRHGDRVLVHLKNCPEFLLSWFGLAAIGAVIVPSNTANTRSEIEFIAERAGIKGAVSEPQFVSVVSGLTEAVPGCSFVLIARGTEVIPGTIAFETLLSTPPIEPEPGLIRPDDVSQILFTSGTTAKPKGVLVTHANALWSGERALKGMGYRQADRCMTALPLFHVNGQAVTVLGALTAGAAVVILEQFVPGEYLNQLRRHRVTQTSLVATQSKALLSQPSSPADRDHALNTVGHAINITNEEKDVFEERFGIRLINIYGLSEATEIVTFSPLNGPQRWPSIGMPAMDREVRVAAGDGVECAAGDLGEIQVRGIRGKNLMAGYFGDSESTEKTFDGEWLRTGDFGYADAAGYIYFVDRQKDLIKSSGQNVSATEVEDVLNSHPFVVESGVIAVDHATRGEAVKAFVVVAGGDVTAEELKSYCAEILSKYKLPEYIEFIDALPRTSVGKIAKGELRTREAANASLSVSSGK